MRAVRLPPLLEQDHRMDQVRPVITFARAAGIVAASGIVIVIGMALIVILG
jgi:hypothetical protein